MERDPRAILEESLQTVAIVMASGAAVAAIATLLLPGAPAPEAPREQPA